MNTENILNGAIESANQHSEAIERIKGQLFTVKDMPETMEDLLRKAGSDFFTCKPEDIEQPTTKIVYSSNGYELGKGGKDYKSIQPLEFFENILKSVETCNLSYLDIETVQFKRWNNDKLIEFRFDLPGVGFNLPNGTGDALKRYITFKTGFGGTQRTSIGIFVYRQICSNGMKAWSKEMQRIAKHTERMNLKALEFCGDIIQTIEASNRTVETWERLSKIRVSEKQVEKYVDTILEIKDRAAMSTKQKNILDKVNKAVSEEFAIGEPNAWTLLNGITRYTNHYANGTNENYVNAATGATLNERAQVLAMDFLN